MATVLVPANYSRLLSTTILMIQLMKNNICTIVVNDEVS